MKILVAAKHVIDHNIQVRVKSDNSGIYTENIKMNLNPFDEIAIETAVQLKEQNIANEVIALSIGSENFIDSLRTALSFGIDRAILVKSEDNLEPLSIAEIFKQIALKENIDLILLGKQSIDYESNQIGQILSYKLSWALANSASYIKITDNNIVVNQEVDNGIQTIKLELPAVITCDLRLNEPRFPTMMNIMQAKRKQIEQLSLEDFNINNYATEELLQVEEPKSRNADNKVKILENIEELVSIIKTKDIL